MWLWWGWTLQLEDPASGRIEVLMSNHHRTAADHTDCGCTSLHPGGQEDGRSAWSSCWTLPPSNQLWIHQLLWRRELHKYINFSINKRIFFHFYRLAWLKVVFKTYVHYQFRKIKISWPGVVCVMNIVVRMMIVSKQTRERPPPTISNFFWADSLRYNQN